MSKDLTQKLNGSLEDKVDWLVTTVQAVNSRTESMDSRIESMDSRLGGVETRLINLGTKVDDRSKETRPIWEAVQSQLTELKDSYVAMRGELRSFRAETEKAFRVFDRQLEHYLGQLGRLNAYQSDLEERVDHIEKRLGK